jgi:hypothetical protein
MICLVRLAVFRWEHQPIHNHHNHHNVQNWNSQSGGEGGAAGKRVVAWFFKYIKLNIASTNTAHVVINNAAGGGTTVEIKEGGTAIAKYTFTNGTNGANGTNATSALHGNNTTVNAPEHRNNSPGGFHTYNRGDRRHRNTHHHTKNEEYGSAAGRAGAHGYYGTFGSNIIPEPSGHRLYYNDSGTGNSEVVIYYFNRSS